MLATKPMNAEHECLFGPTVIVHIDCEEDEVTIILLFVTVDPRGENIPHILNFR
jgi:hypothetical protein